MLKIFELNDKKHTIVAGLTVTSGKLLNKGHRQYIYRIVRDGEVILEENKGEVDLKHYKDSVNEVCDILCYYVVASLPYSALGFNETHA